MLRFCSPRVWLVAGVLAITGAAHVAAQALVPTDIGHLGGGSASVSAVSNGFVVGNSEAGGSQAYIWSPGNGMTNIGALLPPNGHNRLTGVNSSGAVVGGYWAPDFSSVTAFYWSPSTGVRTITNVGNVSQYPIFINDSGVVAGVDANGRVFRWTVSGGLEDLGNTGVPAEAVTGINRHGDLAGNNASGTSFVFHSSTGTLTQLTSPGDATPRGDIHMDAASIRTAGISDSGVVVGTYWDFGYLIGLFHISQGGFYNAYIHNSHAFAWTPGTGFVDLGNFGTSPVPGSSTLVTFAASASAINSAGTIVGHSYLPTGGYAPFTYSAGTMTRLAGANAGDTAAAATGINDDGVVVGFANGTGIAAMWKDGVFSNITPTFAPQWPGAPFIKGSRIAGNGLDNSWNGHAWTLALPSAPACEGLYFLAPLSQPHACLSIPASKYSHTAGGLLRSQSASGTSNGTDRPIVQTVSGAYLTANFTYEVDVMIPAGTSDLAYVGFGEAVSNPNYHNEPTNSFIFRIHNLGGGVQQIDTAVDEGFGSNPFLYIQRTGTYVTGQRTTFRIERNGDAVTMSIPSQPGSSRTFSIASYLPSLNDSNARLFFANTAQGTVFSTFSVTEPIPDPDSDGDGVPDSEDAFPEDPDESSDRDGDGVGDNGDAFPDDRDETSDRDRDGVGDNSDAFPDDRRETHDSDGDGVGDNGDAFPNDRSESRDSDGDGVGDNGDAFPTDPLETRDSDGDGVGDNGDAFPNNPRETRDSDGDGVGDNSDAFPNNPAESQDSDGDGVGNNADAYPNSNRAATVSVGGCSTVVANQQLANGATMNDLLGSALSTGTNRGARVSAVSALTNTWNAAGLISGRDKGAIESCVARMR